MVTTPAMLGDLIKRLTFERVELDIVGELSDRARLVSRLRALRPGLVITGMQAGEADLPMRDLLLELPACKFIVLSHDGRSVTGYQLRLNRTSLADLGPDQLVGFIRNCSLSSDLATP
jgi:hypothetical protein